VLRIVAITLLSLLAFAPVAMAQDEGTPESQTYDPTHTGSTNQTADYIRDLQKKSQVDKGFIKPQVVQVSIVHLPYMDEDQFGLQMAVPDVVSGCYKLTPLEYEANFVDPYFLDIKVKKYRRIAPEGESVASCDRQNKMSTGMMVLSRKDLKQRGTQEIRFSTDVATDNYKIVLNDAMLELIPESMVIFKPQDMQGDLKDRIVYNFTGSNMVTLQVPMAQASDNIEQQLMLFAASHAMMPANNDSASTGKNGHIYYFYDQSGQMAGQIGPDGYGEVGKISVNRPYDGPNGRTQTAVDLSVFVTRPGTEL